MATKPRIAIFDPLNPRERSFMRPLAAHLEANWQVDFYHPGTVEEVQQAAQDCDVLWFEWCSPLAVHATNHIDLRGKKIIVRLHAFEGWETKWPSQMFWGNVDHLILVTPQMLDILGPRYRDLTRQVDVRIIHNGVECDRFSNSTPKRMHDIAWVGRMEPKKNPGMFLQIMHKLVEIDSSYRLHIAGLFSDRRLQAYLLHMINELELKEHIIFHGFIVDMPAWSQDKGILLSTAYEEIFGVNIGEGMAAGAYPVIHNFTSGKLFWPKESLFNTIDEAVSLILKAAPNQYVDFVRDRYDWKRQSKIMDALLAEPNRKTADQMIFTHEGADILFHLPDHNDHIQKIIAASSTFYEPEMLADMQTRLRALHAPQNAMALDVGANIGNHTVYFGKVLDLDTIAFEPTPRSHAVLCKNIALNQLEGKVQALRIGAGAQPGRASVLTCDATNWGMNQLNENSDGEIEVKRLDDIARTGPVVLMKIDVEGMEMDVLRGAAEILRTDRPLLYIEAATDDQRQPIEAYLAAFGYRITQRFNATPTYLFVHPQTHAATVATQTAETPRGQGLRRRLKRRAG